MMLIRRDLLLLFLLLITSLSYAFDCPSSSATVNFGKGIRDWDGFGVNYVEVRHTRDYDVWPQDYGDFSYLSDTKKMEIIDLVFGKDGLQPDLTKMFLCPYHEQIPDNDDPYSLNMAGFDHARYSLDYFL